MSKKGKAGPGDILANRVRAISARPEFEAVEAQIDYVNIPRRKSRDERQNVFRQATILLPHGAKLPCVIKNITRTGARVEFFQRIELTDPLILSEPTLKLRVHATVVWQRDGAAGLRFLQD